MYHFFAVSFLINFVVLNTGLISSGFLISKNLKEKGNPVDLDVIGRTLKSILCKRIGDCGTESSGSGRNIAGFLRTRQ
jgi:hypothetical protein